MADAWEETLALLREINIGTIKFAWLPIRLYCANGLIRDGWAWREPYRRVRCIGFPRYYNERIERHAASPN